MVLSDEQDEDVNECRKRLQALKTEAQNQLLVGNSFLHSNQKELEQVRSAVKLEEEGKDVVEDKKKDLSREFSQVIQAVRNIFSRCQASMRNKNTSVYTGVVEATTLAESLIMNLDVICGRLVDIKEICSEFSTDEMSMPAGVDLGEPSSASASTGVGEKGKSGIGSTILKTPTATASKVVGSSSGVAH